MTREELAALLDDVAPTAREAAKVLGVGFDTVKAWRHGKRSPCCAQMERHIRASAAKGRRRAETRRIIDALREQGGEDLVRSHIEKAELELLGD